MDQRLRGQRICSRQPARSHRLLRQGLKDKQGSAPGGGPKSGKRSAETRAAFQRPARPVSSSFHAGSRRGERESEEGHPVGRRSWQNSRTGHFAPLCLPLLSSLSTSTPDNGDLREL